MKQIEIKKDNRIEQFQRLLYIVFPNHLPIGFQINYFLGEELRGRRKKGLYVSIVSKNTGVIYEKFLEVSQGELSKMVEQMFITDVMNEFLLAGLTFMNINKTQENFYGNKRGKVFKSTPIIHLN